MPIVVNLDIMMARRKMTLNELAERIGITPANPRQPLHPQDGEGQGHTLLHPGSHLPGAGVPAGGFAGAQINEE